MALCIRAANPIWYFVDLVGLQLNDQYYLHILQNTLPYLPQPIFQDPNCTIEWSDPIQFFPNGTLPDNMYWDPSLVYRLEIRQGPMQSDPLIYLIENFAPGNGGNGPTSLDILNADNQISNPQFSQINFTSPTTFTTAGTYPIAPGWDLILTGAGSTTVTQLVFTGVDFAFTSPPAPPSGTFGLKFDSTGWTSVVLQQTFNMNPAIWQQGAIAAAITGKSEGSPQTVTVSYVPNPNPPGTPAPILTANLTTGNFAEFKNAVSLLPSTQSTTAATAQILIQISLPAAGIVDITNIQIVGQNQPLPVNFDPVNDAPQFQQETIERQIDHLFHYYRDAVVMQPKESILTGWQFATNPWQFRAVAVANVATNQYTADQTIIIQQNYVASTTGNNVAVGQASVAKNQIFEVDAVSADNQFGILQYIDPASIRPYWGKKLSALVKAYIVTSHSSAVHIKARLIYKAGLPPTVTSSEPVAAWGVGGEPIFQTGWTAIKPINDPAYLLTATNQGFAFDQFQMPASSNANMTLGIMIYTIDVMDQAATADSIFIDSVSLVENDFAIAASVQTWDESLRKCQYYYEKSYNPFVVPGTSATGNLKAVFPNGITFNFGSNASELRFYSFALDYMETKANVPTVTFYSAITGSSPNTITGQIARGNTNPAPTAGTNPTDYATSNWTVIDAGVDRAYVQSNSSTGVQMTITVGDGGDQIVYSFHYTLDSRLGR